MRSTILITDDGLALAVDSRMQTSPAACIAYKLVELFKTITILNSLGPVQQGALKGIKIIPDKQ